MAPPPRLRILSGLSPPTSLSLSLSLSLLLSPSSVPAPFQFNAPPSSIHSSISIRFPCGIALWEMPKKLTYCAVGSNAISAFLSWRLQATTSCDVTLVWKANFEAVQQYGVTFKYVILFSDTNNFLVSSRLHL